MIDHWWQTETGWAIASNCAGLGLLPVKAGSPTKAAPGYDVRVLDEAGEEVEHSLCDPADGRNRCGCCA